MIQESNLGLSAAQDPRGNGSRPAIVGATQCLPLRFTPVTEANMEYWFCILLFLLSVSSQMMLKTRDALDCGPRADPSGYS